MRWRISSCVEPRFSRPKASSCQTVSQTIWLSGSWNTYPMPEADSAGESASIGRPKKEIVPENLP